MLLPWSLTHTCLINRQEAQFIVSMRSVDRINMLQMEEQSRSDRNIRSVQILSFVQNYIYETGMIPYKSVLAKWKRMCYNIFNENCRCSSMAECQLPKLNTRVRFPSPAPGCRNSLDIDGGKPRIPSCFGFLCPKPALHGNGYLEGVPSGWQGLNSKWRGCRPIFQPGALFHFTQAL